MDEKQLEKMLAMAALKLGMTPDELKSNAKSGNVDAIISKMDKKSADRVRQAMSNKNLTDQLAQKFKNN